MTGMTMVERVARAICVDDYAATNNRERQLWDDPDWRHVFGKMYLDFARAAIAEMREPTEAMHAAALKELSSPTNFPKVATWDAMRAYRAMIDTALSEGGEG